MLVHVALVAMQNPIAQVHIIAAVAALLLGGVVFVMRKGTRLHVRIGIGYVVSMLAMNVTAFAIYRLTGGLNAFHIGAFFSLATVLAGWVPAIRRRPAVVTAPRGARANDHHSAEQEHNRTSSNHSSDKRCLRQPRYSLGNGSRRTGSSPGERARFAWSP